MVETYQHRLTRHSSWVNGCLDIGIQVKLVSFPQKIRSAAKGLKHVSSALVLKRKECSEKRLERDQF